MRMRFFIVVVVLTISLGACAHVKSKVASEPPSDLSSAPVSVAACDRACLENYLDQYLNAMMDNDPGPELFTRDCKFTENGVALPLGGEGLWYGMSGKGSYRFYIPDVETRQIAFIGTVREGVNLPRAKRGESDTGTEASQGTLAAVAIRLKIDDSGKISEAEQLVMRPEISLFEEENEEEEESPRFPPTGEAVENMGAPHKVFTEVIPVNERPSREDLVRVANYYFEGLQRNDGKGYYPFTDDCDRYENGIKTTNIPMPDPLTGETLTMGCKEQFERSLKGVVTRIRDRRFVAVDRERGIVFAFGFFDHLQIDWTWQIAELFKIENGLIRRIEAVFLRCPYGMNSGWSTYEQGMSEEIQSIR
jgi:hypothetical protein